MTSIYILPSQPLTPPRAVIGEFEDGDEAVTGTLITWSQDTGYWFAGDQPVLPAINEQLVNHARDIGIDLLDNNA